MLTGPAGAEKRLMHVALLELVLELVLLVGPFAAKQIEYCIDPS